MELLNLSLNHKAFLWLPPKTATHTVSWIFGHFDFNSFFWNDNNFVSVREDFVHFSHEYNYPPNHQDLSFICTFRNPYERIFSFFKMRNNKTMKFQVDEFTNPTKDEFKNFFDKELKKENFEARFKPKFHVRKPDYLIRTETFYEDLLAIPFIKNSKLYECGILQEMCEKKINKTFTSNFDEYMDNEMKDWIYTNYKDEFELGNYKR